MEGTVVLNVDELVENLKRQLCMYRELLGVLQRERLALVSVKLKDIREATFIKEALLADLQKEENARLRWMTVAATALGINPGSIKLADMSSVLSANQMEALNSAKNALRYIVLEAKSLNTENLDLTESAIRESQVMKENALGLTGDRAATYGPKGSIGRNSERNPRMVSHQA